MTNTTLETWVRYGWLTRHETTAREIADLLAVANRDIEAARVPGLPGDWRLSIAYNAALQAANAALAASGYRAEKSAQHYRIIQSLEQTIGAAPEIADQVDSFRKKRNLASYERIGAVSDVEAEEMLRLAKQIRQAVEDWMRATRPHLLRE